MKFLPSQKPFTVGIELEVQIVDSKTLSLTPKADVIFNNIRSPLIHREFLRSMVEFVSPPSETPLAAVDEIWNVIQKVTELGMERGFLLAASGTHPFADPETVRVTDNIRYLKLLEEFQEILRNFLIYGIHIHIGFPDKESALSGYNAFVKFSPLFLALSVSSPFFKGKNTGILSYRTKLFEQLPRAGVPQQLDSFEQFTELIEILRESRTIESLKDIWWDVRLRPDFGTVELRICDSLPERERLEALAGLAVMIAKLSTVKKFSLGFHQINVQNKWNAARHGLKGKFLESDGWTTIGRRLLKLVSDYTKFFGNRDRSAFLLEKLTTLPTLAERELESFRRTGSFREVMKQTVILGG